MIEVEKIRNWTQPAHRLGTEISYPVCKLWEILLTNLHYLEEKWKFSHAKQLNITTAKREPVLWKKIGRLTL